MLSRQKSGSSVSLAPMALVVPQPLLRFLPLSGLAFVPVMVLGFVAIAVTISSLENIPFTVPMPGNIPGLKTNYWVPPMAAALGYLILQVMARFIGAEKKTWREIGAHAVNDYLLLGIFIGVIYVHFNMKMWIPVINPALHDQEYFAIDQALRPVVDLFMSLRTGIGQFLPAVDIWYQAAFMAIFVLSFLAHALGRRLWHYHNMVALLIFEMLGPLAYFIRPAVGPFIYEQGVNKMATDAELHMYDVYQQVRDGGAAWIAQHGGQFFAQPLAAMPSLHVGASFIMLYYAVKARLWVAPVTAIAFFWIVIESVASRWHYLIDLPVGLLLAIIAIVATNHLCRGVRGEDRQAMTHLALGR